MSELKTEFVAPIITQIINADPVVMCKDCKYFIDGNGCTLKSADYTWEEQMGADDFCSRGERKDV